LRIGAPASQSSGSQPQPGISAPGRSASDWRSIHNGSTSRSTSAPIRSSESGGSGAAT